MPKSSAEEDMGSVSIEEGQVGNGATCPLSVSYRESPFIHHLTTQLLLS
jgi:hypothetical protein